MDYNVKGKNPLQQQLQLQQQPRPQPQQQQQVRFRWTKQKKKRVARYESRQLLKEKGIEVKKPPKYISPHTPVLNSVTREERKLEIEKHDELVEAELKERLKKVEEPKLRYEMTGLEMSDRVRKLFLLSNGSQSEVVQAQKKSGMQLFEVREGDTGSSAVQVVALTTRIQQLQTHMNKHKKDKSTKRGLDALYVRRRKLLDYMERKEFESYRRVVKTMGLTRS